MMAGDIMDTGTLYSPAVGLVFMFNLIVGTGALTMPAAFQCAGWLMSLIIIVSLAFMSFLTSTFVVETMASSNAMLRWRRLQRLKKVDEQQLTGEITDKDIVQNLEANERSPLIVNSQVPVVEGFDSATGYDHRTDDQKQTNAGADFYDISERTEMGRMCSLFFGKVGVTLFYLCIIIYLYGDLAIYAAAVPKSLRDVACTFDQNLTLTEGDPCWPGRNITRLNAYRIFVFVFAVALGPFTFFNVQKTKYLQLATTVFRWLAFLLMITLAAIALIGGEGHGKPVPANVKGIPNLFGVCIYSFMCHHSLPSLITPIRNKKHLFSYMFADYLVILVFYALLSFTAIFTFDTLDDLYTLNFQPTRTGKDVVTHNMVFQYFLALFPVFTLSTNFPIISITLRNNLKTLFHREASGGRRYWCVQRILFPLLTLSPPVAVAFATHDLESLVGITGSYAGAGVQYIFPALLVYYSRKDLRMAIGRGIVNAHRSPFSHVCWVYFTLIWAATTVVFVTVNHALPEVGNANSTSCSTGQ